MINTKCSFCGKETNGKGISGSERTACKECFMKLTKKIAPEILLGRTKEDWYYEGIEYVNAGKKAEGIKRFNKALKLDKNYVDAYNGLGTAYFYTDAGKSEHYYRKAYLLTKKKFPKWPKKIEWGVLENRQYLRAIHYYGLMLWRKSNFKKAMGLFKLLLNLNPNDNQGARYLVAALYEGYAWGRAPENYEKEEKMLERQNKIHKFWKWEEEIIQDYKKNAH
ncbi:tetratricopeptide repeat protein [Candidatus Woesearchaeota archaeon]|nr:tetratricopeptide repeat protein [Candidatus Woesearchaeota archaeon]